MSVFREIDAKYTQYLKDLQSTKEAVAALGGAFVKADSFGYWRCSYRPTAGDRLRKTLKARTHIELIALLDAAPDRPGKTERRDMDAGRAP